MRAATEEIWRAGPRRIAADHEAAVDRGDQRERDWVVGRHQMASTSGLHTRIRFLIL